MSGAGLTFNDSSFYDVIDFSHALIGSRTNRAITRCEFSRFWVDRREQIIQSLIRLREIKHIYIRKCFDRVFLAKSLKTKLKWSKLKLKLKMITKFRSCFCSVLKIFFISNLYLFKLIGVFYINYKKLPEYIFRQISIEYVKKWFQRQKFYYRLIMFVTFSELSSAKFDDLFYFHSEISWKYERHSKIYFYSQFPSLKNFRCDKYVICELLFRFFYFCCFSVEKLRNWFRIRKYFNSRFVLSLAWEVTSSLASRKIGLGEQNVAR